MPGISALASVPVCVESKPDLETVTVTVTVTCAGRLNMQQVQNLPEIHSGICLSGSL